MPPPVSRKEATKPVIPEYMPAYPVPSEWPLPTFSLRVHDLSHPGAALFFQSIEPLEALKDAVTASFVWLYGEFSKAPTNVQSLLLVLRPMPGVAYCTGVSPDPSSHKEIHFSLDHIVNSKVRAREEIMGVLTHEVVHCYQNNCNGSAPGGLIEGIADYVRLRQHLVPPHWSPVPHPEKGDKWNSGYQTTGFFLNWLEERYGDGSVIELNERMHNTRGEWNERAFKKVTGRKVDKLWKIYCESGGGKLPERERSQATFARRVTVAVEEKLLDSEDEDAVLIEKADALGI